MGNEAKNEVNEEIQDVFNGDKHYLFTPSITKTRMVKGKPYIVRSYFTGGKDINETVKRLAEKQAYKNINERKN